MLQWCWPRKNNKREEWRSASHGGNPKSKCSQEQTASIKSLTWTKVEFGFFVDISFVVGPALGPASGRGVQCDGSYCLSLSMRIGGILGIPVFIMVVVTHFMFGIWDVHCCKIKKQRWGTIRAGFTFIEIPWTRRMGYRDRRWATLVNSENNWVNFKVDFKLYQREQL